MRMIVLSLCERSFAVNRTKRICPTQARDTAAHGQAAPPSVVKALRWKAALVAGQPRGNLGKLGRVADFAGVRRAAADRRILLQDTAFLVQFVGSHVLLAARSTGKTNAFQTNNARVGRT